MTTVGTCALSVCLIGGLYYGQFATRVDSVRVDAMVTVDGKPLTGLVAEDFEVRDNGVLQSVRLVGTSASRVDVVLALDMSASVAGPRLAALRKAGDSLLDRLQPDDRAALLTFSHVVAGRQPLTTNLPRVRRALSTQQAAGGSFVIDGLVAALGLIEPGTSRNLLIVFTDGIDTGSWLASETAIDAAKRSEAVVYAVSTAGPATSEALRQIAVESGGRVLDADAASLDASFVRILDEFRQRYLLAYTHKEPPAPGWHRIQVRVNKRGATVRTRTGYIVPRP